jgi:hypothetical protein
MADIVNAGVIVLIAAFGLVAVVGGAHQLQDSAHSSSLAGDDGAAVGAGHSEAPVVPAPTLANALGDSHDKDGKHPDQHKGRDRDDRHGHDDEEDDD